MRQPFDRRVADWLADGPSRGPDDGLARTLAIVARTRQRPGWAIADRWLDAWASGVSSRTWRVALAFVLFAILAALAVIVASQKPSADELVRLSQAVHQDPPPFTMSTTTFMDAEFGGLSCPISLNTPTELTTSFRFVYDGDRAFREECRYGGQLSELSVTDGSRAGRFHSGEWATTAGRRVEIVLGAPLPPGVSPATVPWLNWVHVGDFGEQVAPPGELVACPDWRRGESRAVAGRTATEVSCGVMRYWIDDASRLLVRVQTEGRSAVEATALDVGVARDADLFAIAPPTAVRWALTTNDTPPGWTLPLVGGGTLDWGSLRGKPVIVMARAGNCEGIDLDTFAVTAAPRLAGIHAIAVEDGLCQFTAADEDAAASAGVDIVRDDGTSATGWLHKLGVSFFDAAGRYRLTVDVRSRTSLSAAIDAFVHDAPIPAPPPGDGTFEVGRPAPPFLTEHLDGVPFDLARLRGKPVAVLSPAWEQSGDTERRHATGRLVQEFARGQELVGERATFVVIAWREGYGESPPEGWAALLAEVRSAVGRGADSVIVVEGPTYDSAGWGALTWVGGDPQVWEAAIVVLDADLTVDRLLIEPLPDAEALAQVIRDVEVVP